MKAFKAYDIRGVWGKDFGEEDVYRMGFFLPVVMQTQTILVGRDCRLSSDALFMALCKGITDSGASVADAGITTTPTVYWATAAFGFDASVMITASHNPKEHNGLKVSGPNALPVGYDTGLNKLEALVEHGEIIVSSDKGTVNQIDVKTDYLAFLQKYVSDFRNLNLAIDCSNGMASLFVKELFGHNVIYVNDFADGNFPGHEPNPLDPENQEQIKELVLYHRCDAGIIFDGDADRVMFIDEKGRFVSPDLIIALLGDYFFGEMGQKGKVLQDIRSSRAIASYLSKYGAEVETWRVGRAYGAGKLREINGLFGGELAGHYYFRDFYYSDSGLLAALIVTRLIAKNKALGITFSSVIDSISPYFNSGEINFKIEHKQQAMDAVKDHFLNREKPSGWMDFDGYRLDYQDFWINIRPSNT
ncbi:MAG: phosphomannomutase/phosphoglucomutase, partial [Bacteroidales bacterium]